MLLLIILYPLQEDQQIQEQDQWLKMMMKIRLLCMLVTLLMLQMACKKEKINMILSEKKIQLLLNFSHFSLAKESMWEPQKQFSVS